jgi:hypothetical protein
MINSKGWLWLRRQDEGVQDQFVKTDLDTLATALYVKTDDWLKESPQLAPWRPATGIGPRLSDAELVALAVMQALLGFTSEARWLRHARAHLGHLFPYLPQQPGYNKRLRAAAAMIRHCIRALAADTTVWTDDVWVVDSTPVECGRSRETAKRSDLAGTAARPSACPGHGQRPSAAASVHPAKIANDAGLRGTDQRGARLPRETISPQSSPKVARSCGDDSSRSRCNAGPGARAARLSGRCRGHPCRLARTCCRRSGTSSS